ncbi:MAG: DUF3006 domain-containing protein [Myxococcales bacterium]|nr:DUF3006 domain-containing protein [Myxococcales bacterium]
MASLYEATVDRVEGDRVVVEWCDRTTSDLPALMFAADVREGAVVVLLPPAGRPPAGRPALPPPTPLPEPRAVETGPRSADRPGGAAPTPRGVHRTEHTP